MKKETIEKLIDKIGVKFEELQNTINAKSELWLNNNIATTGTVDEWAWKQYASEESLKKVLAKINNKFFTQIKEELTNTYIEELKAINSDFAKNLGDEITIPKEVQEKIDSYLEPLKKNTEALVGEVVNNHRDDVARVTLIAKQAAISPKVGLEFKTQNTQILYDAIVKATARGIQNMPKVVFKDGRKMNWKSYIEQQTRTRLKQEASDYQIESARRLGVIFWLLSSHFDCADDHAKYQGRIFINRDWQSKVQSQELRDKIQSYVNSHNILFKEDVTEEGHLLKRPIEFWNCRHYFEPITIEQALGCGNVKERDNLLRKLQMKGGTYESQNYKDLKQQRYQERQIRKYKAQLDKDKLQLVGAPAGVDTSYIKEKIHRDRMLVETWQSRQRQLLKKNDLLWRDYQRESPTIVKNDLGARYNKK